VSRQLSRQTRRHRGGPAELRHTASARPSEQRSVAVLTLDAYRPGLLGHHGTDCSFETILRHYQIEDPVIWRIAAIVHEADLDDERYDAPEAAGLDVILRGLSMIGEDQHTLAITRPMFDGLYEYYRRAGLLGREPA
jgi:hypothetical protein